MKIGIGYPADPSDPLHKACRAHANACEYAPTMAILMLVVAMREPDEQIERIRRAHHNDLEAILPFLAVGFLAAATGAVSYRVAWWLFVPFTAARVLHTIAYSLGLQPWRSILFGIADVALWVTTISLLIASVRA